MIEQQGQVVSVSLDHVGVRLGGYSGCPACDAGKGCGAGVFGRLLNNRPVTLELSNELDSRVGQSVIVGLPETLLLVLVARLYLLPLLAGLAGAVIGHYISGSYGASEAMTDGVTLLGAVLAGSLILVWNRKRESEFPAGNAVHLLRHAGRSNTESCAGRASRQKIN
jgi:sigma-E factor negative regulatory protein RseC